MTPIRRAWRPSNLLFALVFLSGVAAGSTARAQSAEDFNGDLPSKLVTPRIASRSGHGARVSPARVSTGSDSVWVGHSIQVQNPLDHTTFSYGPYHVGVGLNRPNPGG